MHIYKNSFMYEIIRTHEIGGIGKSAHVAFR